MFVTRYATPEDAAIISRQRQRMFVESGQTDDARMAAVSTAFEPWVRSHLEQGNYIGWITSSADEPERIVAGAGLLLVDFPPHFLDPGTVRGYLLNFYVEPEWRGHGLAYSLLKTSIAETRRRGIGVVSLHASKFGKPLYERNGFKESNEMLLRNP